MTNKELEKELAKTHKEMHSWPEINRKLDYAITEHEVNNRELVLSLQQILYRIEDAKKEKDKNKEYFNSALYYLTKSLEE